MFNWSTDEKKFKKKHPKEYRLWRLTQLINYGLDGEKLDKKEIKRAWPEIKDQLDPNTVVYFNYLLWGKRPSSIAIKSDFWHLS
ncbi:MAG: hypothetical protein UV54_C0006G0018 [Candidatus Beckwithbacteria bacterium GW2011_GWA2_43_10]|uniref:Uncharacterized protein n=1 Tax=Candidatus Beckwithbacteria bacterium GW2011_GWA2_43_10 TaxID=1618369 RepID=A0A0G1F0U7_9BACT|nr:MAG: hypothetical protein UV54_C0006G0018 [Candidatus Beckwithbacteria bacterium GW2011_GWA2_43_10]